MDKGCFGRKDRLLKERRHDVYRNRSKLPQASLCTECGVAFCDGRWTWERPYRCQNETLCPACRRVREHMPAGEVTISGQFFRAHHDEIMNLVRNIERVESNSHPLERIMEVNDQPESMLVTTTGMHLANGIGRALRSAYKGAMQIEYLDGENYVKVCWTR
ncbi:BCAM0308 family protein [Verrucomicrobiota bacterium]